MPGACATHVHVTRRPRRVAARLGASLGLALVLAIGTAASSGATSLAGPQRVAARTGANVWSADTAPPSAASIALDECSSFHPINGQGEGPVHAPYVYCSTEQQPNQFGWYDAPVLVQLTWIAWSQPCTCPPSVWLAEGQSVDLTVDDGTGRPTTGVLGPLQIDQTPPTITITNGDRTWPHGSLVAIGCDISDNRSGLVWLSNPCPFWGQPASDFEPGTYTVDVQATDAALNYTSVTTTFTIVK